MLVAMFNAVKVESVPLKSDGFFQARTMGQDARCPAHHSCRLIRAQPHAPHLAVVAELVRRGHRVTYIVGGHLADLARPTGADVVGFDSLLPGSPGAGRWPEDDTAGMRMFLDDSIHVLPQVWAALDDDRPDVDLHDIGG
jgi:hypothetical protein